MPFKKGDPNINRAGRPRKGESLPDIMEKILDENEAGTDMERREALCRKVIELASDGESWAVREVFDRIYGKPIAHVQSVVDNSVIVEYEIAD